MWIKSVAFIVLILHILGSHADPNCTDESPCVRFCCSNCTHELDIREKPGADKIKSEFRKFQGRPCKDLFAEDEDEWSFQPNGEISFDDRVLSINEYCFEWVEELGDKWILLVCFLEASSDMKFTLFPILIFLSLPFSIITFFVYAWIKELRNLHGKCLMCYVMSVIVLQLDLAFIQLDSYELGPLCTSAGFLLYYAVFVSNFWLNVMTFDIWQTFKNFRITSENNSRFKAYCCYAFLTPLLMTIILAIIDTLPLNILVDKRPNFGAMQCALETGHMDFYYYVIPMDIVTACSAVFVILATFCYWKRSKIENTSGYTRFDTEKDRFMMYLKLFGFMAIIWSCEIISHSTHAEFIVSDIVHCLQGVVIFVIFVLQKNIRELIRKEYNERKGITVEPQKEDNDSESMEGMEGKFQKM